MRSHLSHVWSATRPPKTILLFFNFSLWEPFLCLHRCICVCICVFVSFHVFEWDASVFNPEYCCDKVFFLYLYQQILLRLYIYLYLYQLILLCQYLYLYFHSHLYQLIISRLYLYISWYFCMRSTSVQSWMSLWLSVLICIVYPPCDAAIHTLSALLLMYDLQHNYQFLVYLWQNTIFFTVPSIA